LLGDGGRWNNRSMPVKVLTGGLLQVVFDGGGGRVLLLVRY
jgi:hypothetical protein